MFTYMTRTLWFPIDVIWLAWQHWRFTSTYVRYCPIMKWNSKHHKSGKTRNKFEHNLMFHCVFQICHWHLKIQLRRPYCDCSFLLKNSRKPGRVVEYYKLLQTLLTSNHTDVKISWKNQDGRHIYHGDSSHGFARVFYNSMIKDLCSRSTKTNLYKITATMKLGKWSLHIFCFHSLLLKSQKMGPFQTKSCEQNISHKTRYNFKGLTWYGMCYDVNTSQKVHWKKRS